MDDRRRLAVAATVLSVWMLMCVALAVLLLRHAAETLPGAWAALGPLPEPMRQAASALWGVAGRACGIALICGAAGLALGWALVQLPRRWALLASAMLSFPSYALGIAWTLGFCVMLQTGDALFALRTAGRAVGLPGRPGLLLIVFLLPVMARPLGYAWRRSIDTAAVRAAVSLGVGPWRLSLRAILPVLWSNLRQGVLLVGLFAAVVLAIRAEPAPVLAAAVGLRALAAICAVLIVMVQAVQSLADPDLA